MKIYTKEVFVKTVFLLFTTWLITLAAAQTNTEPLWQVSLDSLPDSPNNVFIGDTVMYYFQDNQLNTIDIQTGETLWQGDYPLITLRDYTLLPAYGEGLIFIPRANTIDALNEQTGEKIWGYELKENLFDVAQDTNNRTGVFYSQGYVFAQTQTTLVGLEAAKGRALWQKDKTKEDKVYSTFQVLNDKVFAADWTDIQELPVLPHAISSGLTFYSLDSGEELWTSTCTLSCTVKVLSADDNAINLVQSDRARENFLISRNELLVISFLDVIFFL
jgi:outer membrane protein assembly factor BamB